MRRRGKFRGYPNWRKATEVENQARVKPVESRLLVRGEGVVVPVGKLVIPARSILDVGR